MGAGMTTYSLGDRPACSWARYKEPGTGKSYRPTWVVAVPATHPPKEGVPVRVVSKAGKEQESYVHSRPLETREINGVTHTLHRIDDDPFGSAGDDEWFLEDIMPDVGDK